MRRDSGRGRPLVIHCERSKTLGRWLWCLPTLMSVLVLWAGWLSVSPVVLLVLLMPLAVHLELRGLDPRGSRLVWRGEQWELTRCRASEDGRAKHPGSRRPGRRGTLHGQGRLAAALWLELIPVPVGSKERGRHLLVYRDALTARDWSLLRRRLTLQGPA